MLTLCQSDSLWAWAVFAALLGIAATEQTFLFLFLFIYLFFWKPHFTLASIKILRLCFNTPCPPTTALSYGLW